MDQNILQMVKDAAIGLLKGHDPEADVYAEEIMRTEGMLETKDEDTRRWYFVEVVPTSFVTWGPGQTEVTAAVAIDYHEPEESIRRYGEKAIALDGVFRPVFHFSDHSGKRGITVARVSVSISGGLLHLTVPLSFLVSDEPQELPAMEYLETSRKREG